MFNRILIPILMCLLCMPALGAKKAAPKATIQPAMVPAYEDFDGRVRANLPVYLIVYYPEQADTLIVEGQSKRHIYRTPKSTSLCGKAVLPPTPKYIRGPDKVKGFATKRTKHDCSTCLKLAKQRRAEYSKILPSDPRYKEFRRVVAKQDAKLKKLGTWENYQKVRLMRYPPIPANQPFSYAFPKGSR